MASNRYRPGPGEQSRECTAVIGDLVSSRTFRGAQRNRLQAGLQQLLMGINARWREAILARFVITTGDEFQGLLSQPACLPDLIWFIEDGLRNVEIRVGIGFGTLETELAEYAIGMDGSVWHAARGAVTDAKKRNRLGGVFRGFGERDDSILNGLGRFLFEFRRRMTPKQRQIVEMIRETDPDMTQTQVAERLDITKQAVSKHLRSAAWGAYQEGEDALYSALAPFDRSQIWRTR